MILKELLKQPPSSTLIEGSLLLCLQYNYLINFFDLSDSWLQKGRPLFLSLIRHYSENGFSIRYFKYDSPLSNEKDEMEQFNYSQQMQIIDDKQIKSFSSLENCWSSNSNSDKDKVLVAIDSLSPLLLNWTVGDIATALRNMQEASKLKF